MKKVYLLSISIAVYCLSAIAVFATSPYISRVYDYSPAPGQFVNLLPKYEAGNTHADMTQKAEDAIANNKQSMITLGAFGGYVIFGFDHMIENVPGEYDFVVLGNANTNGAEPGVVSVSYDANGNGLPDDDWFELAGSEYASSILNYQITYTRPSESHVPTPDQDQKWLIDSTYVPWRDNQGDKGYINQLSYHTQPYYPQWLEENEYTLSGTKLPGNAVFTTIWTLPAFDYGYADNYANDDPRGYLKIDWAVKADGTPANLPGIQFVKVHNGLNQQCGMIGETSTEITGAIDLHLDVTAIDQQNGQSPMSNGKYIEDGKLYIRHNGHLFNLQGVRVK